MRSDGKSDEKRALDVGSTYRGEEGKEDARQGGKIAFSSEYEREVPGYQHDRRQRQRGGSSRTATPNKDGLIRMTKKESVLPLNFS